MRFSAVFSPFISSLPFPPYSPTIIMTNCAGSSTSYWICGMSSSTEPCVCRVKEQWQHMWIHWYWIVEFWKHVFKYQVPLAIHQFIFSSCIALTRKKKSVKTINEANINVKYERLFVKYIYPYCCLSISITKDINPSWIHTNTPTPKEPIKFNCSLNVSYCHITVQQYWDQGCSNVLDGQRWDSLTLPLVFTLGNNIPASYQMSSLISFCLKKWTIETIQDQPLKQAVKSTGSP